MSQFLVFLFFFCQAEDGIRDRTVTGVQTCALPISAPRAEPAMPETPDLVGSWAAYQRLLEGGIGSASLAELIAGVRSAPAAPAPGSPLAAAAAPAAVDVRALLYRGDRALQRAQELRAAAKRASGDELRALVDEVCDLVALALEPSP